MALFWLGAAESDLVADEQLWATLRARFVYDDVAPTPAALNIPVRLQDESAPIIDESLLVNSHDRGIQNIVVSLCTSPSNPPPIDPAYQEMAKAEAKLTVENHRLEPHIVLVRAKHVLTVTNLDAFATNIMVHGKSAFSKALKPQASVEIAMNWSEPFPVRVSSVHPWLHGWIMVSDHPYVAKTDSSGRLTISNLPVGTWTFQAWHERAGLVEYVEKNGKSTTWNRGRFTVKISEEDVFLGKILLNPIVFDDDD